ncbi:MAG: carbamoyltransferase HypF [Pseudobdellovibrionaceae bacterium]
MIENHQTTCLVLHYFGQVQGVGMRPFLFRLADELNLKGKIFNHSGGVTTELEGSRTQLENFHQRVISSAPPPILIQKILCSWQSPRGDKDLEIISLAPSTCSSRHMIQPDAATCQKCWSDFFNPQSRFYHYSFVSCCECGPRWSILHRFPFERFNTSYESFPMCHECQAEYQNPQSRRYYAQTLSCAVCGPRITISTKKISASIFSPETVQKSILDGQIGLVKGLGGFQLIGLATNPATIERIRNLKSRPSQSLAIMVRDLETFLNMGGTLTDWKSMTNSVAPILSVKNLKHPLSLSLAPDLQELGVMAPTTPLHFMLFGKDIDSIVVTSGNPQGHKLPKSKSEIQFSLDSEIDFIIDHDRDIIHSIDDSVVRGELVLRKARGLTPVIHTCQSKQSRIALGTDLKNAMAIQIENDLIEFPYCGDLGDQKILEAQTHQIIEYLKLFGVTWGDLTLSAIDFHPETTTQNLGPGPHTQVPHHLAHAWSAFHQCPADLILTFDGTGYDEDFELGGGDGFTLREKNWHRVLSLKPLKWVGGNSSVIEPWKSLVIAFASAGYPVENLYLCLPEISKEMIDVFYVYACSESGPLTTSMGRWFDAAAAMIDFGAQKQTYEAQAPIRLEHLAKPFRHEHQRSQFLIEPNRNATSIIEIDGAAILFELYHLKCVQKFSKEEVAFAAHDFMAGAVARACLSLPVKSVTGTGGVFQNALFTKLLADHLRLLDIQFSLPKAIPVNDQCIALGQIYYMENLYA